MRQKLIAGNWKMNGSAASAAVWVNALKNRAIKAPLLVCPPAILLSHFQSLLADSSIMLGAQDVSEYADGAYTGETSARMLVEAGCRYVIVGHSERRTLFGDTDARVAKKFAAALAAGLIPILCVGETLAQRDADQTETVIATQLDAVIALSGAGSFANAVIAYEPVWAIGTGKTATPAMAQAVHAFIRAHLATHEESVARKVQILYGGSVKSDNARALFSEADIDGGLIGGASLKAEEFSAIGESVEWNS